MELIGTIIIGLIVGVVAKLLMPGRDPGGFIITILLGIAGAFVGTYIGRALGFYAPGEAAGFLMSLLGAVLLLLIYRMVAKRPA
ncbi:MAG TPA: GlsB/YeaQ/YmgE family stress response membrane protein [Gemmatimonadaceae bacterium]|nr:GlsB/YeaQ/YmgE family stress response membrane protein [Gemmatimonadaceae bacterium]